MIFLYNLYKIYVFTTFTINNLFISIQMGYLIIYRVNATSNASTFEREINPLFNIFHIVYRMLHIQAQLESYHEYFE